VDREEALRRLGSGETDAAYLLGPDYLATGRVERIVLRSGGFDVAELEQRIVQEQRLAALLRRHLAADSGLPSTAVERLVTPVAVEQRALEGGPSPGPTALQFLVPYAFSTLFVISIFITSGYLLQSVTEEKENRVVEIVLSSVPALPLMSGKILGLGAAGLTQVAVWLATALLALPIMATRAPGIEQVRLGPEVVLPAICYFVLGYVAYGAIFSAIGALAPGTREAQQYSGFFGVFAVVPLIFTAAFLSDIGSPIVTALSLFPLTAPAAVLQVLVLADEPPWLLVGISLALLAAFTALATLASARVFRATLLLYGMRPSLRQVAGAILSRS
jgi:ABC-2 type transport system permease protein